MPNTLPEQPGRGPRQTRNTSTPQTSSTLTPARVPWEIKAIALLAVAVEERDRRIRYYEAEDHRKAVEIDRLSSGRGGLRSAA